MNGRFFNAEKKIDKIITFEINKNKIILKIESSELKNVNKFNFTILTRKYVGNGRPDSLVYYDKMSKENHFIYEFIKKKI